MSGSKPNWFGLTFELSRLRCVWVGPSLGRPQPNPKYPAQPDVKNYYDMLYIIYNVKVVKKLVLTTFPCFS